MKTKPAQDDKYPVYVTNTGHRYVKVDELLQSKRVQETLREMAELADNLNSKQQPPETQN